MTHILLALLFFVLGVCICTNRWRDLRVCTKSPAPRAPREALAKPKSQSGNSTAERKSSLEIYKSLYFKLQNLELHPDILPQARELLLAMLSESLDSEEVCNRQGIFAIEKYSESKLLAFLHQMHSQVEENYAEYLRGRAGGKSRRLLTDRTQAMKGLTALAPAKLIDGAWLGYIHQVGTFFPLRAITKGAWQILSEELGDGNLEKNHVWLYQELLQDLGTQLPQPYMRNFVDPAHDPGNFWVYKASVIQLLVPLFPQEFLPEILGFNMHFEGLTLQTLILSQELQELKINPKYFLLHISIDNMHSGHAMMSACLVTRFLNYLERSEGLAAAEIAWKRVQSGYALSAANANNPEWPLSTSLNAFQRPLGTLERDIMGFLKDKAAVAQKIHIPCPAKVGSLPLSTWLDADILGSEAKQVQFLSELSLSKRLVIPGNAAKSTLIREMSWGGKMFGAFTEREIGLLSSWINSLDEIPKNQTTYWQFTGRHPIKLELSTTPVLTSTKLFHDEVNRLATWQHHDLECQVQQLGPEECLSRISSLWFSQLSLLENYPSVPSRISSPLGCAITQILRAQYGFRADEKSNFGMDEINRTDVLDLVDLGLEIIDRHSKQTPPRSLSDIFERFPCPFAEKLVEASKRPVANIELLLGISVAFVELQRAVASSEVLLSHPSRKVLDGIIIREASALEQCQSLLQEEPERLLPLTQGYQVARMEISRALQGDGSLEDLTATAARDFIHSI